VSGFAVPLVAAAGPWAFTPSPGAWLLIVVLAVAYITALHRLGPLHAGLGPPATKGQQLAFAGGLFALALALGWPLADLGRSTAFLVHMTQVGLLTMVAPPLLLLGLPRWLAELATRPRPMDSALRRLTHPVVATLVFNTVLIGSLLPPVVDAQARSTAVDATVHLGLVLAGLIMWMPALRVPGARMLSTAGRIGYLCAQAVVPSFPALIFIFARHPLYAAFAHSAGIFGISVVADQQVAGAIAKLIALGSLGVAVAVILVKTERAEHAGADPDTLTWDDVERELRRLERRPHRRTDAN
jgi:putative membrane protein